MATTVKIAPREGVTIAPLLQPVLGGPPEPRVQFMLRSGAMVISRTITPQDAYMIGMAFCAAAGDVAP